MDVFSLRQHTKDYAEYASSFIQTKDDKIHEKVEESLGEAVAIAKMVE